MKNGLQRIIFLPILVAATQTLPFFLRPWKQKTKNLVVTQIVFEMQIKENV